MVFEFHSVASNMVDAASRNILRWVLLQTNTGQRDVLILSPLCRSSGDTRDVVYAQVCIKKCRTSINANSR
jgi:hypothetical protein